MEPGADLPFCPPPWERPSDVLPMLIVLGCFLLAVWLIRLWKKKRNARKRTH